MFYSNFVYFENRAIYEKLWKKYRIARQATDENTAQAHCMLNA